MEFKKEPFSVIVDPTTGGYSKEYMDWAIQTENYPGSSMMREDLCGVDSKKEMKEIKGVTYISTGMPFKLHDEALECVLTIRNFGGLAFLKPCQRRKEKMYMVWFNPNGSKEAREYVMSW